MADVDYSTYGMDSRRVHSRCRPVSIAIFRVTSAKNHFPTMTASLQLAFSEKANCRLFKRGLDRGGLHLFLFIVS
ncbi:hypothetical protein TNCV_3779031 [Trichonephila clavipes]|nr:hypothetical protein TNCV_3779031 [Trichonephila clavipes]